MCLFPFSDRALARVRPRGLFFFFLLCDAFPSVRRELLAPLFLFAPPPMTLPDRSVPPYLESEPEPI